MSEVEIRSRQDILFENYCKIINIEALTMIDIASRDIVPAVNKYIGEVAGISASKLSVLPDVTCAVEKDIITKLSALNEKVYAKVAELKRAEAVAASVKSVHERAEFYKDNVIPMMTVLRALVDEMETLTAANYWPLPSYGDMLFCV